MAAGPTYDRIGTDYDTVRRADPYLRDCFAQALRLEQGGQFLELGCGTGNYTIALAGGGGAAWTGIDESSVMIARAKEKSGAPLWVRGHAEDLPFAPESFSGVLCVLAMHHFHNLRRVCAEAQRVVGRGPFVIFTSSPEQMRGYWLNEYFPMMMQRATAQMPAIKTILDALLAAGFASVEETPYFVRPDLEDWFLYSGKHSPAHYLNEIRRNGSSSFRTEITPDELHLGCLRLESDLADGRIEAVTSRYQNRLGDYLLVVATGAASR